MVSTRTIALVALCALAACRTLPLGGEGIADGGVEAFDGPRPSDLALRDAAPCVPVDRDAAVGDCPCGASGLCRAATGRLSVQTRSMSGQLRLVVMDDNGCRKSEVASDLPIGVPRWAPDHERLAYITGSGMLNVIRVAPSGKVMCRASASLGGVRASEVAWAGDNELWLATDGALVRWRLGAGWVRDVKVPLSRFDALGDGPLVVVEDRCGPGCASRLSTRPSVEGGPLKVLAVEPMLRMGPVRLAPEAGRAVFELAGLNFAPLQAGPVQRFGDLGDRSPAFALDGRAIVYTTDDGRLRYHVLLGPDAGQELTLPSSWRNVYSPDWAPPPLSCDTKTTCW
ncbi:MAG: hypothetical protein EXR72_20225 [Myxococcales bacterium]|nr:hypothetical protein [Myxococcales bacterium]